MAPTRRKRRYVGCSIERTRSGLLRFRFRAPGPDGVPKRFAEATALTDSADNRARLERQAAVIAAEVRAGTFDYLKWFPHGNRANVFAAGTPVRRALQGSIDVGQYYLEWVRRKVPPMVRPTRARDYRNHFRRYLLGQVGDVALEELSLEHLDRLRVYLRVERCLSEKTVRNVIDGTLRAMVRDARKAGVAAEFPFPDLEWGRAIVPGPDPFSPAERDQLLEYFRCKTWRVGRGNGHYEPSLHPSYYAFLLTLFFTGMRPSEAAALRVRSLDLATGSLYVERSRSLGYEAAPKTAAAARIVRLTRRNGAVLTELVAERAAPDSYVFMNTLAQPIEQRSFYRLFRDAQHELELRPRDLYATKDTYISVALTAGVNLTWLSEQTGVAEATLRKHYGRFIHSSESDAIELAKIDSKGRHRTRIGHRLDTDAVPAVLNRRRSEQKKVEQKGFEPSTPTLRTWCSPN